MHATSRRKLVLAFFAVAALSACYLQEIPEAEKNKCPLVTPAEISKKFEESLLEKRGNSELVIRDLQFYKDQSNPFWTADIRLMINGQQRHLMGFYFCAKGVEYSVLPN